MEPDNTGGPAFPIVSTETNEHGLVFPYVHSGMSLRDYFAAQALIGIGNWTPFVFPGTPAHPDEMCFKRAEWAYAQADAMLEARKLPR